MMMVVKQCRVFLWRTVETSPWQSNLFINMISLNYVNQSKFCFNDKQDNFMHCTKVVCSNTLRIIMFTEEWTAGMFNIQPINVTT